jgi:uncharacterized protein YjiS (DUF1127 family)
MRPHYFDFDRYRWRGTYPPRAACSPCRELLELLLGAPALARLWRRRVRERRELARLDDRMLRDIGLSPSERARELDKPFWRA